jgi:hypothetical protein
VFLQVLLLIFFSSAILFKPLAFVCNADVVDFCTFEKLQHSSPKEMEGSSLSNIAEASQPSSPVSPVSLSHNRSLGAVKKVDRRNRVHRLSHSGGSNGRTFDLDDIASGSNGSHVTSTERACRVAVTILEAKDLKRNENGPDARDPVFKVKVDQVLRKSTDIKTSVNQVPSQTASSFTIYVSF